MPPQRIRFFNERASAAFRLRRRADHDENLRKHYTPNCDERFPLRFFARGEPYKLLG
jgi:hypothetical protein